MATVLIVDDDASLLRLYRQILKLSGYQSLLAENGQVGLDRLAESRVDLIILDLDMPVMNGREFFRNLTTHAHRPPVLIMSAFNATRASEELGAEGAIDKPFDPDTLLSKIEFLLQHSTISQRSNGH
jgi:two-component system KDP operon response regulator KdpE